MTDQPLPKMSYEQQQSYNALAAIDAAAQPYTPGEDIMTTIARQRNEAMAAERAEKIEALRAMLGDFLDWYLRGPVHVSHPDEIMSAVDEYLKERIK